VLVLLLRSDESRRTPVGSIPASGTKEDEPRRKAIGRKQLSFVGRSVIASPCRITRANGYAGKEAIEAPSGVVMNAAEITLAGAADSARQVKPDTQ